MGKSTQKKAKRLEEKMSRDAERKRYKATLQNKDTNEVRSMLSIAELQKMGFGAMYREKIIEAWRLDWYFSGWEKLAIMVSFFWTVYSVGRFLWGLM